MEEFFDGLYDKLNESPLGKIGQFFQPIYDFNDSFAAILKMPPDNTMYLIILVFPLFLSVIYRLLPHRLFFVKHCFNLFFGLLVVGLMFGWSLLHPLLTTLICYVFLRTLPLKLNLYVTSIFMFGHLSITQLYKLYFHYLEWRASFHTVQMLLTFKLIAVVWNLYDAKRCSKEGEKGEKYRKKINKANQELSFKKTPSLLQYLSFSFHYGTVTTAPVIEYKHFIEWIENVDKDGNVRKFPLDLWAVGWRIIAAFGFMILFVVSEMMGISIKLFADKEWLDSHHWLYILIFSNLLLLCVRSKYLFAFFFAESICVLSGFGYSGKNEKTGKLEWKNCQQTDMGNYFECLTARQAINAWNIGAAKWLRHYVYYRVRVASRLVRQLAAMTVSALWHGFYPGYYLTWPFLTLITQVYVHGYKKIRPRVLKLTGGKFPWWMYISLMFFTRTWGNNGCVPFHLLSLEASVRFLNKFYWGAHVFGIVALIILSVIPVPKYARKKKKEKKKD